jgi:hypothetical protein
MRLNLFVPCLAALLTLCACNQQPASKTEIAAQSSTPAAPAANCPPQPAAPACAPAAGKAATKAKAAGPAVHGAKAVRTAAASHRGRTHRYASASGRGSHGYGRRRHEAFADRRRDDDQDIPGRYGPYRRYSGGYEGEEQGGGYDRREERRYSESGSRYEERDYGSQGHWESRDRYYESGRSTYVEDNAGGPCCGSGVGAAGFDGYGYLTWPGKVPARP